MKSVKNCLNCDYRIGGFKSETMTCSRPSEVEGRVATNLGNVELACPCHSEIDRMKREGMYIGGREFHLSKERLLELEKLLFG